MPTRSSTRRTKLLKAGVVAFALALLLAAAWRWSPLHAYAEPKAIAAWLHSLRNSPWAPLIVIGVYVAANAMLFPNTILNVATILGLGTALGLPCALAGSLSAALVAYAAGRYFGAERLQRLRIANLVLGMAMLRLLPIAPFTVVNLMAGAARVGVFSFAAGTVLGLLPGNLLVTAFGHQLRALIRDPSATEVVTMIAILLFAIAALWWLRRRVMADQR